MSKDRGVGVSVASCRLAVITITGAIALAMATRALAQDPGAGRVLRPQPSPTSVGAWRLVRTPHPRGGADAVSIMRTADGLRSDPDLAGLMVRCADGGFEVLVVLISPVPPRARPEVTFRSGSGETRFVATVVPPGAAILLPKAAAELATGPWHGISEVLVEVSHDPTPVKGVIPLAGLKPALDTLTASCRMQ